MTIWLYSNLVDSYGPTDPLTLRAQLEAWLLHPTRPAAILAYRHGEAAPLYLKLRPAQDPSQIHWTQGWSLPPLPHTGALQEGVVPAEIDPIWDLVAQLLSSQGK